MSGALIPLPARGSAPCSTSGRTGHVSTCLSGPNRAARRRGNVRCCADFDSGPHHGLGARQPLDSIDNEWRAFNQDRAKTHLSCPSEVSVWDLIDPSALPSDLAEAYPAAALSHLGFQDRFWEHTPTSTTDFWDKYGQVHVILFGVGEGEPEGIYSVRAVPGADQLPQENIIAFEGAEDAQRYASRLEATMERAPNVVPITPSELLEFCKESGYNCRLEQEGSMPSPPDFNVDITDWERSLRLRNGLWSVVDESTQPTAESSLYSSQDSSTLPHNNAGVYLPNDSVSALEELRIQLEKLMQL